MNRYCALISRTHVKCFSTSAHASYHPYIHAQTQTHIMSMHGICIAHNRKRSRALQRRHGTTSRSLNKLPTQYSNQRTRTISQICSIIAIEYITYLTTKKHTQTERNAAKPITQTIPSKRAHALTETIKPDPQPCVCVCLCMF